MQVIIHIGDAKCGSSAIQASLFAAEEALLARGIIYHAPRSTNGHSSYITLMGGQTRGDNDEQAALARRNVAETRELIATHRPRYLLLSAENFFTLAPERVTRVLSEVIGGEPEAVHILGFLRHPVGFYLSGIQQELKASHEFLGPADFQRDMASTFRRWLNWPACASVTARLFDRRFLTEGSAVAECASVLRNITGQDDLSLSDADQNTSLSAEQTILLQQFRRDFLAEHKNRFRAGSNRLVRFFEALNAQFGLVGTRARLTQEVRSCIQQNNEPFIREVDTLFPDLGMMASQDVGQLPWEEASKGWSQGVETILQEYDPKILERLRCLVPEYNPPLAEGDVFVALKRLSALGLPRKSRQVFRNYLTWCELPEAAQAVLEAGPLNSGKPVP